MQTQTKAATRESFTGFFVFSFLSNHLRLPAFPSPNSAMFLLTSIWDTVQQRQQQQQPRVALASSY